MTPKEARNLIRYEILTLKAEQIEAKKVLGQPHGPYPDLRGIPELMGECNRRAAALTAYHNALNELCGRKTAHEYKDMVPFHPDGGARENIESIRREIVWPVKSPVSA